VCEADFKQNGKSLAAHLKELKGPSAEKHFSKPRGAVKCLLNVKGKCMYHYVWFVSIYYSDVCLFPSWVVIYMVCQVTFVP
jgi:hypothetical protein